MTGDPNEVVAVVVTYRADPDDLLDCLDALRRAGGLAHVVVVDNGGTVDLADDAARTIVRPPRNAGYGAAANEGAAVASSYEFEQPKDYGISIEGEKGVKISSLTVNELRSVWPSE